MTMSLMNELALFAGAGGGILGGHLLGWRTVCAVEWEPYPASVLCARQNDGFLPPFPIWDDVQTFDGKPWRGIVDVVSGGFPCQDISAAGRGAGITGERSGMWNHMARIVGEVRPRYVYVENSPMLTSRGLGTVLGDLASLGFDARWGVLGAADVGAPHQRDRIWIMAHSNGAQRNREGLPSRVQQEYANSNGSSSDVSLVNSNVQRLEGIDNNKELSKWFQWRSGKRCEEVSDTSSQRQQGQGQPVQRNSSAQNGERETNLFKPVCVGEFWRVEPNVGRVANGVAARVDRLKAIGNGQVPAVAAAAFRMLGVA